jgi:hypothetical protein
MDNPGKSEPNIFWEAMVLAVLVPALRVTGGTVQYIVQSTGVGMLLFRGITWCGPLYGVLSSM